MNQFFEAAVIALGAIWANKLRSFLTVLGNIVAVTSIIAVVSLVQGMNGYVTDAILSGVGADNFTIQRMPVVRTEADEERVRNNPRIKLEEAAALRRYSDNIGAVAAQTQSRSTASYGSETVDGVQVQGVSRDYVYFGTFNSTSSRPSGYVAMNIMSLPRRCMCGHMPYSVTSSLNAVMAVIFQSSANGGIVGMPGATVSTVTGRLVESGDSAPFGIFRDVKVLV